MMDRITAIAQAIKSQHEAGEAYTNLTGDLKPNSIEEAYAAQRRLHELHAENGRGPLGGRKIALASKVQQQLCGVDHPIAGGIFANEIMASPATIRLADYHGLGIEFELAIRLGRDLGGDAGSYDKDNIRPFIAGVHPAYELIIDRKADYGSLDAVTMVADNAWCGGVVLGPALPDWPSLDLDNLTGTLTWTGEAPASASTGDADPLGSLAWVANVVNGTGEQIRAGDIVITGSVIKTRYPTGPMRCKYDIGGLAAVELDIV